MNKHILVIIFSIILTIAYCDFIDSIKRLDKVISNMLKLESINDKKINTIHSKQISIPLKSKH